MPRSSANVFLKSFSIGIKPNYLDDGRLPIDNSAVERDLRALTIGRNNWLFIGSPQAGPRAAVLYTLVASAARHDLDVWAYLCDVLQRLAVLRANGLTARPCRPELLTPLLPDVWAEGAPGGDPELPSTRAREPRRGKTCPPRKAPCPGPRQPQPTWVAWTLTCERRAWALRLCVYSSSATAASRISRAAVRPSPHDRTSAAAAVRT